MVPIPVEIGPGGVVINEPSHQGWLGCTNTEKVLYDLSYIVRDSTWQISARLQMPERYHKPAR